MTIRRCEVNFKSRHKQEVHDTERIVVLIYDESPPTRRTCKVIIVPNIDLFAIGQVNRKWLKWASLMDFF